AAGDLGRPDDLPAPLPERDDRRLAPSRRGDEDVAIDERRLRVSPRARLAAEVLPEALLPARLARRAVEAGQVPVRAEDVDRVAVEGGRRASAGVARLLLRVADVPDPPRPDLLAA